ncbi:hypothetical protein S40288_06221 [Stachybotrys chartarum IBT 40288]|nr:hypothetical protein S40288_06221 [Stachybotrys chartarum IBT 40288]
MSHPVTYDALHSRPAIVQRPRPTELLPGDRVPLNQQKVARRESRLGLRNLFGRSKNPTAPEGLGTRPNGPVHAATADVVSLRHKYSDVNRPESSRSRPSSVAVSSSLQKPGLGDFARTVKHHVAPPPLNPLSDASWAPPPLFKAYPRAIRDATLFAPALDADSILRLSEKSVSGTNPETGLPVTQDQREARADKEKTRRKHRQTMSLTAKLDWSEWVSKIYILDTSGHLLQYSSDGTYDQLPEKVLQLSKASAAFATDVISGRHWVLQVSSFVETEVPSSPESRSILSKLHLRSNEKRSPTNMLMVFESAEDMDGWMVMLRREIERLGGKRPLSETGEPKTGEDSQSEKHDVWTSSHHSSNRSSRHADEDTGRVGEQNHLNTESSPISHGSFGPHDPSHDDRSTTDSLVSQDGRQLDNLRDGSQRLSYISSGQRTIVTSADSSPACSPVRDTFSLPVDESSPNFEARPRPNANAILHRRKSLQTITPFVEPGQAVASQQPGDETQINDTADMAEPNYQPLNFSVPRSSNRRFSSYRASPLDTESPWSQRATEAAPRVASRKPPPAQLRSTRPLSIVLDLPSPQIDAQERPATHRGYSAPQRMMEKDHTSTNPLSRGRVRQHDMAVKRSNSPEIKPRAAARGSPRRMASLGTMRNQDGKLVSSGNLTDLEGHGMVSWAHGPEYGNDRPLHANRSVSSPTPRSLKRASMHSMMSDRSSRDQASRNSYASFMTSLPPLRAPPPSAPLPPLPNAAVPRPQCNTREKVLGNRRSMPQLPLGPPTGPPPTCNLPPIPQGPSI